MPEFRKDPVVNRWVILATDRANRPQQHRVAAKPAVGPCPFCTGNESMTPPEILAYRDKDSRANQPGWALRVVPNRYPALVPDGGQDRCLQGIYESMNGVGAHEVVIETQEHLTHAAELSEKQFDNLVRAYRDRTTSLRGDTRWRHVLIYKNEGAEAGATFEHLHSQLVALPMVPRQVSEELDGAQKVRKQTGKCVYCEIINADIVDARRIVSENRSFVALCPYAARFPFETWILPKHHSPYFDHASELELGEFALLLRETLIRLDRRLRHPPFNYVLHSAPFEDNPEYYHWHVEIMPRLTGVAGFEWGTGFFINTEAPEDSARELRNALC
jgi:UDPglucose--hexose-1-phosphate uridylyltransferase